jgi:Skp family chaperone for outer membrane proteins
MVGQMRHLAVVMMVFGLTVAAPVQEAAAQAAQSQIVVLNTQRLMSDSAAGQSLSQQIGAIQQQVINELGNEERAIRAEEVRLQEAAAGLTRDQLLSNSTLTSQMAANDRRLQALQQRAAASERDLQYTELMALRDFNAQLGPIVDEVMASRGALYVLNSGAIVRSSASGVDITDEVIARLDQRLSNLTVTRQTAPAQ